MTPLDRIRDQVTNNTIVLYMKGTPQFPQCGFSSRAAQVLQACGVKDFLAVNGPAFDTPDAKGFLANLKLLAATSLLLTMIGPFAAGAAMRGLRE